MAGPESLAAFIISVNEWLGFMAGHGIARLSHRCFYPAPFVTYPRSLARGRSGISLGVSIPLNKPEFVQQTDLLRNGSGRLGYSLYVAVCYSALQCMPGESSSDSLLWSWLPWGFSKYCSRHRICRPT